MNGERLTVQRTRGLTLIELTVALALLASAFVGILDVLRLLGSGLQYETVRSDLSTRTEGTLYDMVAELRQAAACSSNFYIEQNAALPPRITFDLVDRIDTKGNIVWGNKVTYRLVKAPETQAAQFSYLNIVPGQILRDESGAVTPLATTVVEELVPYQFSDNGVTKWGFSVSRSGSALTLSTSRFGTTAAKNGNASQALMISTVSGTYYLRNSAVVPAMN
jgi:prepilin-type N-terminal cleavage/methylation domain-containing protein